MKKIIYLAVLMFVAFQFQSQAQADKTATKPENDSVKVSNEFRGPYFIDADKDGICDNRGDRKGYKRGPRFVDADKDGICDHRENLNSGDPGKNNKWKKRDCPGRGPCGGNGFRHRHGWRWQN